VPFPTLSIPEMAAIYVDAIREAQPQGPYFLAGFSLGGTIAYETAHQISAKGGEVGLLVLIDSVPPRGGAKLRGLRRVARKLARHLSLMSDIAPAAWPAYLFGVLRRSLRRERRKPTVPAPALRPQSLAAYLFGRYDGYEPPPYHGPMKVLRCSRGGSEWNVANLGWADYAKGPIEIAELPGDHTSIMGEPIVALVAAYIDKWLAEAAAVAPPPQRI
jgi:thioesterase domain-containing protein